MKILKSLYEKVSCMIRTNEGLSKAFNCRIGVRQGCVLSPLLFNLFVDNIIEILEGVNEEDKIGLSVGDIVICALLHADDLVLLADSWNDLQNLINRLSNFCEMSCMKVNFDNN